MKGPQITSPSVPGGPQPATQANAAPGAQLIGPGWRPMLRKPVAPGSAKQVVPGSEPF
jgi:hypothetical protein